MKQYFTADAHFGHANIIKYTNRPFKSLDEMNSTLIKNWNSRVKEEDTVFHIGDFCFRNTPNVVERGEGDTKKADYYEKQLNGKIIFEKGNHDKNNSCKTCIDKIVITYGGYHILLTHNPVNVTLGYDLAFVGHIHNLWKFQRKFFGSRWIDMINVGVDVWNFYPVAIEDILKEYHQWKRNR